MIYITSDTHYNHKNIVKSITKWEDKKTCRDFDSVSDMNDALVDGINSVVGEDDILYHLGDFAFGGVEEFRSRIKCKNVHLIAGNHDNKILKNDKLRSLFSSVSFYRELWIEDLQKLIVMSHYPMKTWNMRHYGSWMLYGHVHGNLENMVPASILLDLIDSWRFEDIMLLSENKKVDGIDINGRTSDMCIDLHPNFRPFSIDEIKVMFKDI